MMKKKGVGAKEGSTTQYEHACSNPVDFGVDKGVTDEYHDHYKHTCITIINTSMYAICAVSTHT